MFDVLSDEGAELIEHNAETILEEIGMEFRDDPEVLENPQGRRRRRQRPTRPVRPRYVPPDHPGKRPKEFTQYARNPANTVRIGGKNTVLAPLLGRVCSRSDGGRRYATIEDQQNFVKLAYLSPDYTTPVEC